MNLKCRTGKWSELPAHLVVVLAVYFQVDALGLARHAQASI